MLKSSKNQQNPTKNNKNQQKPAKTNNAMNKKSVTETGHAVIRNARKQKEFSNMSIDEEIFLQDFFELRADFFKNLREFSVDAEACGVFVAATAEFRGDCAYINLVARTETAGAGEFCVLTDEKNSLDSVNRKKK